MKQLRCVFVLFFLLAGWVGAQAVPDSGKVLQSASWTKLSFKIKGTATLTEKDGVITLALDEKFKTRNAPDLKLFLSPLKVAKVTGKNATSKSRLIAPLKKNKKAQSYILPKEVKLSDYQSILLHCEKYSKVWGGFDLKIKSND